MGSESKSNNGDVKKMQNQASFGIEEDEEQAEACPPYNLVKFKLYETRSNFYMVGRDKSKKFWRVLKIDRSEPFDLVICEDPTVYSYHECCALLERIHEGNRRTGGLKIVTTCYGIVGFIKFLGPYYMILITERRKVGIICGHPIYAVAKSKLIPVPHSSVRSNLDNSKKENRYKKLLCTVDITKDFFFSYSYRIMHTLQKNLSGDATKLVPYETTFVWNAFLTWEIRSHLQNTLWTVPLVHGFFKQAKFTKLGRTFHITLIARRSRHYAGTRYLKRGINEKGRAANDVETEQIVFEEVDEGRMLEISSVVQIRGSIPLFWSQETSRLNLKPGIILSKEDPNYEATRRHFQDLVDRYGTPIVILNLIKTKEKKPRESILHVEFVKAVATINRDLDKDNRLKFRTVDLNRLFRIRGAKVLRLLNKVAGNALDQTGFFYCQLPSPMNPNLSPNSSHLVKDHGDASSNSDHSQPKIARFQSGVLRTNCIDCLDRTNVAQFSFGLVALGHQLNAIGISPTPRIDLNDELAESLMELYEAMGDTLALQYGGSAAHNKIFSERRGHWKAATQSQEFIRTLQRYLRNAYMDPEKQDAINLSFLKRSLSDGVLIYENSSATTPGDIGCSSNCRQPLPDLKEDQAGISESTPEILTCDTDISYSRFTPSMSARQLFTDMPDATFYTKGECSCYKEHGDEFNCADILDLDWVSSSANSCEEEEAYDRSSLVSSPAGGSLLGSAMHEVMEGQQRATSPIPDDFPESFAEWVEFGTTIA